jgi:hypothetical protein
VVVDPVDEIVVVGGVVDVVLVIVVGGGVDVGCFVKRLVRFVNFYDPGSVHLFSTHVLFKSVLFKYSNYYHICDFKYLLDKNVVK